MTSTLPNFVWTIDHMKAEFGKAEVITIDNLKKAVESGVFKDKPLYEFVTRDSKGILNPSREIHPHFDLDIDKKKVPLLTDS